MGMRIENLDILSKGLECMGDTEHAEDIRQAIDTMRKYQKIQQILSDALADVNYEDNAARYLDNILEVIRWSHT